MKLNIYVYLLVSVFLSAYSTMNKEEPTSEGAPNVLFIPVDDLKPMLSCYGDSLVKTPNIDRIAKRGTVFLNTACQQAICGPSRASLLTGMYPDQTKVWDLTTKMRDINPDILTIPQYFKQQGYTTTGIGKTFDPRCVDNGKFMDKPSWSIPYQKAKSIQYANPEVKVAWGKAEKLIEGQTFDVAYKRNRAIAQAGILMARPSTECMDVPDDIYSDGANTKVALDLMEKLAQSENPFFLSVGYAKPHLPFIAPKKYWDLYDRSSIPLAPFQQKSENGPQLAYKGPKLGEIAAYSDIQEERPIKEDKQRELIHGYMASVSYVDAQIGLLLDKLEELGIADNTIICLWGDHGFHLGDHGLWTKHTNFEQAVRSPMIISSPAGFTPSKTNAPVEFVDIFPTLCSLADLDIPKYLPGKNLVPIMKGSSKSVRHSAMAQYTRGPSRMGYTLRSERYRYVKWIEMKYYEGEMKGSLITNELYDYEKDPLETINLADDPKYRRIIAEFEREFKSRNVAQTRSK